MTILADRIEFCWIHLRGIGTLENSLWGYDGQAIRIWLNALNIEATSVSPVSESHDSVAESVSIPLDFYPLCCVFLFVVFGDVADIAIFVQPFLWTRVS